LPRDLPSSGDSWIFREAYTDFKTKIAVQSTDSLPFSSVGNNMGICFIYDNFNENWSIELRNPNLFVENS